MYTPKFHWYWGWSPERKRAFIVDREGYEIVPPVLTRLKAEALVRKHNQTIDEVAWEASQ